MNNHKAQRGKQLLKTLPVLLLCCASTHSAAAPVVATPGSTNSYEYLSAHSEMVTADPPSQGQGSGWSKMGKGTVTITKAGTAPPDVFAIRAGSSEPCGSGCTSMEYETGAGYLTLRSQIPVIWSDVTTGIIYPECRGAMECTLWVNANANLQVNATAFTLQILNVPAQRSFAVSAVGGQSCIGNAPPCTLHFGGKAQIQFSTSVVVDGPQVLLVKLGTMPGENYSKAHEIELFKDESLYVTRPHNGCGETDRSACTYPGQPYLLPNGKYATYITNNKIAVELTNLEWGCSTSVLTPRPESSTDGLSNTLAIVNSPPTCDNGLEAAFACNSLTDDPSKPFYLPAHSEYDASLNAMRGLVNRNPGIGIPVSDFYYGYDGFGSPLLYQASAESGAYISNTKVSQRRPIVYCFRDA